MKGRLLCVLAVIALIAPTSASLPADGTVEPTSTGMLEAGAGQAEITPPIGTTPSGYGARQGAMHASGDLQDGQYPYFLDQRDDGVDTDLYAKTFLQSEGVHTRLYANAHVLTDDDTQLAVVQADLGQISGQLHQGVANRLEERGIPIDRSELLLGATHTHGGPGALWFSQGYALIGGDAWDPRVYSLVADQITEAIVEAWNDRQPATLAVGTATLDGASSIRSMEAHQTVHDDHPSQPHVDPTARIFRLDNANTGVPIGVITQFAAHGTIVGSENLFFTGDNQGVANRMIQQGIAERSGQLSDADDVVVSYLNGAEGDVSPVGDGEDFFEAVEDAGRRQAQPILDTWQALDGQGTRDVDLDTRFRFLCFCGQEVPYQGHTERISPIPILGTGDRSPEGVVIPGHGNKTPLIVGPGLVPQVVRFQVVRIDDHLLATVPGEPTMASGLSGEEAIASLPSASGIETVDIVGLASGDSHSYVTLPPEYEVQAYEGSFTLFGRMMWPLFEQTLVSMADALLKGEPVDVGPESMATHPDVPTVDPVCPSTDDPQCVPTGTAPAEVLAQPTAEVSQGQTVSFAWTGGRPGVDHPLDRAMVEIVDTETGQTLVDDTGFTLRVWYDKVNLTHQWSVDWPTDADTPPGTYVIEVTGRYVDAPGEVAEYSVTSDPVTVTAG